MPSSGTSAANPANGNRLRNGRFIDGLPVATFWAQSHPGRASLMKIILEDFRQHRSDIFAWGFWALLIYRIGALRTQIKTPLIRKPWGLLHKLGSVWAELAFGISIGINAKIGRRFTIEHLGGIVVNNDAVIGDDVIIRQGVTLGNRRLSAPNDAPIVGSRVNIGAGAKILGAVRIGNDVAVGANAVVLCDVPDGCRAVGVPARIIVPKLGAAQSRGQDGGPTTSTILRLEDESLSADSSGS